MNGHKSILLRTCGALALTLALGSIMIHGASSTNFQLDRQTTPGAGGDSFSTSYHLVAVAPQDPAGELRVSTNYQLETIFVPDTFEPVDTTPPVILSGPVVVYVSATIALVEWETDELTDGSVDYGLTTSYGGNTPQPGGFSTLHQVLITGLAASTTYNFRVSSTDPYANGPTQSGNGQFTTPAVLDTTGPLIVDSVTATSTQSTEINFTTNESATSNVEHGPTAALGASLSDAVFRTGHTRSISGITPGTTLFYEVTAVDPAGNAASTGVQMFVMPQDVEIVAVTAPDGKVGDPYSLTLTATGGVGAIAWTLESGTLPSGMALNAASGEIAGTPGNNGVFNFTVRATDGGTPFSTDTLSLQLRISSNGGSKGGDSDDGGCSTGCSPGLWLPLVLLITLAVLTRRPASAGSFPSSCLWPTRR